MLSLSAASVCHRDEHLHPGICSFSLMRADKFVRDTEMLQLSRSKSLAFPLASVLQALGLVKDKQQLCRLWPCVGDQESERGKVLEGKGNWG